MFKNPFSPNGRIGRTEYGLSVLIYVVFLFIFKMSLATDSQAWNRASILFLCIFIPLTWFLVAQAAKRCHDRDRNGWWQFIPFYSLWLLFAISDYGANEY